MQLSRLAAVFALLLALAACTGRDTAGVTNLPPPYMSDGTEMM